MLRESSFEIFISDRGLVSSGDLGGGGAAFDPDR